MRPITSSIAPGLAFQTRDGQAYSLRRVRTADAEVLHVFLCSLSDRSRRMRFMTGRPFSPELMQAEVARMIAGSTGSYITLIATEQRRIQEAIVAVAELACYPNCDIGEFAVVVLDDVQRKGIGSVVVGQLVQLAQEIGLSRLQGDMLAENYPMQRLVRALGLPYTTAIQAGEIELLLHVPQRKEQITIKGPYEGSIW